MKVNQWVPAAHKGDAIGDSARHVRDLLRRMGHESELYALTIDEDLRHDVLPFGRPPDSSRPTTRRCSGWRPSRGKSWRRWRMRRISVWATQSTTGTSSTSLVSKKRA